MDEVTEVTDSSREITPEEKAALLTQLVAANRARKAQASSWIFNCPKVGHSYDPQDEPMVATLGFQQKPYIVRICVDCGCLTYTAISPGTVSPIVDAAGGQIISE